MASVRTKDTRPELAVRKTVHRMGYRYRLHDKGLPGKPDIVLPGHRKIIFVHGCFWHQHIGCSASKRPATNIEFWNKKLDSNMKRDLKNQVHLKELGWQVCIIWECETKKKEKMILKLKEFLEP